MLSVTQGCSQKPKIEITPEYIKSKYWNKSSTNFFIIEKMKVKQDSVLNIFQPGFNLKISNHWNITEKLEVDTSFVYTYDSHSMHKITGNKIFFNQSNEGDWVTGSIRFTGERKKMETIGNLENNTWYKFSKLRDRPLYIYVYVDSTGKVHRFDQDLSNY